MAEKENKAKFEIFRASSIITLVVVVILFVMALFNQDEITFSLFGYRHKQIPAYSVMLWSFLAGVIFTAVLWILYVIKTHKKMKYLRKTIRELKDQLNPTGE